MTRYLVDDLARDIPYALRSFRRAPLAALTIVATVALGLGLVAVVFTVYNTLFLRADAVRNPGELFAVTLEQRGPGDESRVGFTRADYDALRRETSVFSDAFAMLEMNLTRLDGRLAMSVFVTGNFFQVLGVQPALGRPLLPEDDERFAGRPVVVLSHAGWRKLFQGERGVIGRRVVINGAPYEIVGVMPDGFRGLGVTPPDYWAPLAVAGQFRDTSGRENERVLEAVGRLKPGLSPEAATAALAAWASGRTDLKTLPGRSIQVRLRPRQGTLSADDKDALLLFSPLFFAFGLILAIGCANVANLLLARGISRQREIGIRLSLGASRRRIIRQLLTESLLLALAAAACGLVVSHLLLESAFHVVVTTLPPEIAQFVNVFNLAVITLDWRMVVFLVAGAIVSTVVFGLAPALQATRPDVVPAMHGQLTRGARPRTARHALIAVQVGASALLLICAAVFLRGAVAAATRDPGVRTTDTLRISLETESRRAAVLQALTADPLVAIVAAASQPTRGTIETGGGRLPIGQLAVSSEYFNVLGFEVVSGRNFTHVERSADAGVAIVTETIARQLWPKGEGVGQPVRFDAPQSASPDGGPIRSRTLTLVGVVRTPGREPESIYVPASPATPETALYLRVRGNPEQARQFLAERLSSIDPTLSNVMTLRAMAGMQAYMLQMGFWAAVALAGLALVLTVSGLFSVLSYVVEQRAKEIGVRMALGATTRNIAGLVLSQSVRPIGLGLVAGGGIAAALAIVLMTTPVASEIGDTVRVFDPVAYAASLLVIVTSCALAVSIPALRAARIDPIATLRRD
jgi:predicted permease